MAENSLQNQKNEVSFVLSDNAKTIIEKFEEKLREGNYAPEEKNGIRAELVWQLLRKQYPEKCGLIENTERLVPSINKIKEDLLSFGLLMLYFATPTSPVLLDLDTKQMETLYEETFAVADYYSFVIVNYSAYRIFKNKYYELCLELCGKPKNIEILHNQYADYPLFWILLQLNHAASKGNQYIPDEEFDFVVLSEDKDSANESSFCLNGNTYKLQDFVCNHLSDNGTLFYKAPDFCINKTEWFSFRKWMVDNRLLHGVIQLPRTEEGGQILIIGNKSVENIFFVDARSGFTTDDHIVFEKVWEAIQQKNPDYYKEKSYEEFVLNNSKYCTFIVRHITPPLFPIQKEGEIEVKLGELIDLCESEIKENVLCYFLNRKYYFENDLCDSLEAVVMPRARRVPNDNFFLFKWDEPSESFLCAYHKYGNFELNGNYHTNTDYYYDCDSDPIVCTYFESIIFKLKENPIVPVDPYYLMKLFYSSEVVIAQMDYYKQPYWDCPIENEDFLSIVVTIPSIEEQQRILTLDRQKTLADTKEEIQKNYEAYKQDIRMKKHALAQRLRVMKNWWQSLQAAREDGNGIVNDEAVIGKLHPVSVKEIYSQIDREMNMLFKQVNAFNLGDTMSLEVFDAKEFVQQYVKQHDPMFEYQCELPQGTANIRFPKDALQIILDNIASNACSHGFKGRENESNIIKIVLEIKGHDLIVRIGNNGNPMSPSMTAEKVFIYGDTTEEGVGEHGGLGGFQIKDLMSKFGNVVELELDENAEFPVVYKLVFRDVNIYK